jgi:hypothetical protein
MTNELKGFNLRYDESSGNCIFEDGYVSPVLEMYDENRDYTIDKEEARYIVIGLPPEGGWIMIDLLLLENQEESVESKSLIN